MKKILLFGLVAAVCFSACKKSHDDNNSNKNEEGVITAVGSPDGTPVSRSIDGSGGSITSTDGRLTIDVPAGAFNAAQQITIQPITNNGPMGVNKAYRITPHNIQFAKPVKMTFSYTESDVTGSAPEFLGISYQDERGVWQANRATKVDTNAKTVSAATSHFSDWNIFQGLAMTPEDTVLETGKFVKLKVFVAAEDYFVPIPLAGEDLFIPLPSSKEIPEKYVRKWIKSGEGTLSTHGNSATYSAPAVVPTRNPVSVSAELEVPGKGKSILVANINVVSNEAVVVKAAAGAGSGSYVLTEKAMATYDAATNLTSMSVYEAGGNTQSSKRLEILFKGNTADSLGWNYKNNIQLTYTVRLNGVNTVYYSKWTDGNNGWVDSPGGVYITSYGNKGEYITGTFTAGKSGYANGGKTVTTVNGTFKIKRL